MGQMDFWQRVDHVRTSSLGDEKRFQDGLFLHLANLSRDEFGDFKRAHVEADRALSAVSVADKDLHTLVYEAWGGCSDDSYMDFRSSVIANGREYYQAMLADPVATLRQVQPPTFNLRFEGAIFSPMLRLEQDLDRPRSDDEHWETPPLARQLLTAWEARDEDTLRESFTLSLRDGPKWAWGLASRWLRHDMKRSLGPAPKDAPEEVEGALSLIQTVPTDGRARRARRKALKALRDAKLVADYAAQKHLESPWEDGWLQLLEHAGGDHARLVFRTLAATGRGEARLRALHALEKHDDALGVSAALLRSSADEFVAARGEDPSGFVQTLSTSTLQHDALAVACNVVQGIDPYFLLLFEAANEGERERAWRLAATWLVRIAGHNDAKAIDALKIAYATPKRRSHAGLCLALLGDDTGLSDVAELVQSPADDIRVDLAVLKAVVLHGPSLGLEPSAFDRWKLQDVEIAAGKCALSGGNPALLADLKSSLPAARQVFADRIAQYEEGLISDLECRHYIAGVWAAHRVLRRYTPEDAAEFENALRAMAKSEWATAQLEALVEA
ncbi:MAG: DUF4240 domain-containing protein [Polyangiales bacterium]